MTYDYIKENVESLSGEKVFGVTEVTGVRALIETSNGVLATLELNDDTGAWGSCRIDREKYEETNRDKLADAKKLATKILKL